ncbi:MAG: KEOPS complex N(6)-L-threonylcarbamoyladenine synthase Kae1 [Nitrososphaerota archaeon]
MLHKDDKHPRELSLWEALKEGTKVVLGIESTAHTFGVGVASSDGRILANENRVYKPPKGGIHPREAAQHHARVAPETLRAGISRAGISLSELDGIAFSVGPGLGPCLRTGATIARTLALSLNKPLIAVNHSVAHIEIGRLLAGCRDPMVLYVAGGNTLVVTFSAGRYRVFGETLDIAAGNCLDAFGIKAGIGPMPMPELMAEKAKSFVQLPYTVKGMDVSFSGLLTAAFLKLKQGVALEDVCLGLTETVYSMLTEVTERAVAYTAKKEILVVGGLARSKRLREMLDTMARERGAEVYTIPDEYAGDNGAMIAWNGVLQLLSGMVVDVEDSRVKPRMRIDEVDVKWFG